ncbi:MAG: YajQ family cyclic di-GMP-binding protein [Pseudonocardia sp.]|nr:YajQ family cyclic di-GMP-binding protein [Pseudonocardia sp.]
MADPSFDVVSKVDRQEVDNALNQAAKELSQRFDFRGTNTSISWAGEEAITIESETEERAKAAVDVFKEKLIKRNISMKAFEADEPTISGKTYKIAGKILQGIEQDKAKEISKAIRDEKFKGVQAQIQGDQLRVTGKKKDDLQSVIALLKGRDFGIALQFTNYR